MYKTVVKEQGGYVALMAIIVIGAILLVVTVDVSMLGAVARFTILGHEAKEQATALAYGCVGQAAAQLVIDPTFRGGSTSTTELAFSSCYVFPFQVDVPTAGLVTFRVQANVRQSVTNLVVVKKYNNIHVMPVPKLTTALSPAPASVADISVYEVSTLP